MARGKRTTIKRFVRKTPRVNPPSEIEDVEARDFDAEFKHLTSAQKLRRQAFAKEYIKDYNGGQAMARMGYKGHVAQMGSKMLRHPYTQWYLGQLVEKMEEKFIVSKNLVLMRLVREAHLEGKDGSHAARVSALRTLAKCLGLEITKVEGNMTVEGGVMLVPFSESTESWEQQSKAQQAELKRSVRT